MNTCPSTILRHPRRCRPPSVQRFRQPTARHESRRLFPAGLPTASWSQFPAQGFSAPVTGVIHRRDFRPVCGAPIGAVDTGALDIETSGTFGYSSIFNDLSPLGGPVNQPFLGLSVGGQTWVLTTGRTKPYDAGNIPPLPGGVTNPVMEGEDILLQSPDTKWQNVGEVLAVGHDQFPIVFRTSVDQKIFKAGDFGGHTPQWSGSSTYADYSFVKWTAPADMTVRVTGGVWSCFDARTCDFVIRHNGRDIFGGLPDGQLERKTIDPDATSEKPVPFDLPKVVVQKGDVILFAFRTNGRVLAEPKYPGMGTFFGMRAAVIGPDRDWALTRDFRPQINPDGAWSYGYNFRSAPPTTPDLELAGVKQAQDIEYFGHYPVIDLEYETDAPVTVGTRIWSPFLPGDLKTANTPGAVFEVHLRNPGTSVQAGTLAFHFPGFQDHQSANRSVGFPSLAAEPKPPVPDLNRSELTMPNLRGVSVLDQAWNMNYTLAAITDQPVRTGGSLGADGAKWAALGKSLPAADATDSGSSLAVPFTLQPGESQVVRYVLAWYAPEWEGTGTPFTGGSKYSHMYAANYADATAVAGFLAQNHASLLRRILAWQEAIYTDKNLPGWLADSLINNLYLFPECSVWAQAKSPIGNWCRPEDGIFGMIEASRSCPQMECLPVTAISGLVPQLWFFPELVRANARTWKAYQLPTGQMPFHFGLYWDMVTPGGEGNQEVMNGGNYMAILDRYWVATKDDAFIREFYESAKKACLFSFESQRTNYGLAQIVAMPTPIPGSYNYREWFEDREWKGYVAHPGGFRLAQARMMRRWAEKMGDAEFVKRLDAWLAAGAEALEKQLWNGRFYDACNEPESGYHLDFWFTPQLNGQLYVRGSGLEGVFPSNRIQTVLDHLVKVCSVSKLGIPPNTVGGDFKPYTTEKYENNVIGAGYLSALTTSRRTKSI